MIGILIKIFIKKFVMFSSKIVKILFFHFVSEFYIIFGNFPHSTYLSGDMNKKVGVKDK